MLLSVSCEKPSGVLQGHHRKKDLVCFKGKSIVLYHICPSSNIRIQCKNVEKFYANWPRANETSQRFLGVCRHATNASIPISTSQLSAPVDFCNPRIKDRIIVRGGDSLPWISLVRGTGAGFRPSHIIDAHCHCQGTK